MIKSIINYLDDAYQETNETITLKGNVDKFTYRRALKTQWIGNMKHEGLTEFVYEIDNKLCVLESHTSDSTTFTVLQK